MKSNLSEAPVFILSRSSDVIEMLEYLLGDESCEFIEINSDEKFSGYITPNANFLPAHSILGEKRKLCWDVTINGNSFSVPFVVNHQEVDNALSSLLVNDEKDRQLL